MKKTLIQFCTALLLISSGLVIGCSQPAEKKATAEPALALRIAPGDNNPRNSEGDFITLKDGRILFVYSRYFGTSSDDHATAYLAGRFSSDGGKTWTQDDQVIVEKEGDMNVMSVSLLRLKSGEIALFYLRKNSTSDCIPMMRISTDEAKTWSDPITCIMDKKGYFVLNNDRVIQMKDGRLLMAVALHQTPEENVWHNDAVLYSYYSDDNGKTWTSSAAVANPDSITMQEPGVVELNNGDVMMIIRASPGVQYAAYSKDRGQTWSPAAPTAIKSPLSPATIQRIPSTGDLLMVWNNNGGEDSTMKGKRTPLTIAISKDEGKTWLHTKNIETDPDGWYCYIAMEFVDNEVLLGYCAGSQSQKTHLSVTDIKRVPLDWVYDKTDSNK